MRAFPIRLREYFDPATWVQVPLHDPRFWWTQALVLVIAAGHVVIETSDAPIRDNDLYFIPISFFFIPVVYAAVSFGSAGAVPTAVWCVLISVPNVVLWHSGLERSGILFQTGVIILLAVFVGTRVDRQERSRAQANEAGQALRVSESKYRGLFETSGEGVLVLRRGEEIVECNPAAARLIGISPEALHGSLTSDVLPPEVAVALADAVSHPERTPSSLQLRRDDGREIWVEPVSSPLLEDDELVHVVLREITEQKNRQQRLETYATAIVNAQEEERRRVAHELHDETIQSLIQLHRMIDAETSDTQATRAHAESIVEGLRGFIQGLRPPALDDLGLADATQKMVTDFSERCGIAAQLTLGGTERRHRPEVELALFRIAQEALNNVERHSEATRVQLDLQFLDDETTLSVVDNGKGFDVPDDLDRLPSERQLGLMGMGERARTLGGELRVESAPGEGTRVSVTVPV